MKRNLIETVMGAVVLSVAAFFLVVAYKSSGLKDDKGTLYWATFDRVDGLVLGSDIKMSGVKIGVVTSLEIDPNTFLAKINFTVRDEIKLPKDTSAEIVSDGLMGGKYMALIPGGDDEVLAPLSQIVHTQASVSLEAMIGQLIFSKDDSKKEKKAETPHV